MSTLNTSEDLDETSEKKFSSNKQVEKNLGKTKKNKFNSKYLFHSFSNYHKSKTMNQRGTYSNWDNKFQDSYALKLKQI